MPSNIYETMMTRNAKLARFTDENPNFAGLFQKIIDYSWAYCAAKNKKPTGLEFRCMVPKGEDNIIAVIIKA